MKLFIREKLASLHDRYYVYNEFDELLFEFESQMVSIGDKTRIYDFNHNEIAYIEQKVLHYMPHYEVYINNNFAYNIVKKIKMVKNYYELSNNYIVEGNILCTNYKIINDKGVDIANINRKLINLDIVDKYQVDVIDTNDLINILIILVAITNDIDRNQKISEIASDIRH